MKPISLSEELNLDYFKTNGFQRKTCPNCGSHYWTLDPAMKTCQDAPCTPYSFIGNPATHRPYSVGEMREAFLQFFERRGHQRLSRYPIVARWRDDVYLVNASIYDFQPLVTSGAIPPPANPLVLSQPCIRLVDLDLIGISGRHLSEFEMMAHHAFSLYWKDEAVAYCQEFLTGLGVPPESISYKESVWYGGGNAGPNLEVCVEGLEVATLVFMCLQQDPNGSIEVEGERYAPGQRIIDPGYGLERLVWLSKGSPSVYDAIYPEVIDVLLAHTPLEIPPQGATPKEKGKGEIDRRGKIYAIADHARCLAFMLGDGLVPSNAQQGYLARMMIRRALRLLWEMQIDLPLSDVVALQRASLTDFPELSGEKINEMLELEEERYRRTIKSGSVLIQRYMQKERKKKKEIPLPQLIEWYDSHGLPPEQVREIARPFGIAVKPPKNFYDLVAQRHGRPELKTTKAEMELPASLPTTDPLFYEDPRTGEFEAVVTHVTPEWIMLDRTAFYPEGGGQPSDRGTLTIKKRPVEVLEVKKVNHNILHFLEPHHPPIQKGDRVHGSIDWDRRTSLMRSHTATHILLGASREELGDHIWQAGAQKGIERSRLDVTHYKDLDRDKIEMLANELVMADLPVEVKWMDRNEAEQRYGFRLYQGGIPPGSKIRVVRIGEDAEACGGIHCTRTGEVGLIKILRCDRIQDGVIRIEFATGSSAIRHTQKQERLLAETSDRLHTTPPQLPSAIERRLNEGKKLAKEVEEYRRGEAQRLLKEAQRVGPVSVVVSRSSEGMDALVSLAGSLVRGNGVITLLGGQGVLVVARSKDVELDCAPIVQRAAAVLGGKGGGKPDFARGGGPHTQRMTEAMSKAKEEIIAELTKSLTGVGSL